MKKKHKADKLHKELVEAMASNDESLMEKYFDKGELDEDEMKAGLKKAMINHDMFPSLLFICRKKYGKRQIDGFY